MLESIIWEADPLPVQQPRPLHDWGKQPRIKYRVRPSRRRGSSEVGDSRYYGPKNNSLGRSFESLVSVAEFRTPRISEPPRYATYTYFRSSGPAMRRRISSRAQTLLAGDAIDRPGNRPQPPVGNGISTIRADPIFFAIQPLDRSIYQIQLVEIELVDLQSDKLVVDNRRQVLRRLASRPGQPVDLGAEAHHQIRSLAEQELPIIFRAIRFFHIFAGLRCPHASVALAESPASLNQIDDHHNQRHD